MSNTGNTPGVRTRGALARTAARGAGRDRPARPGQRGYVTRPRCRGRRDWWCWGPLIGLVLSVVRRGFLAGPARWAAARRARLPRASAAVLLLVGPRGGAVLRARRRDGGDRGGRGSRGSRHRFGV